MSQWCNSKTICFPAAIYKVVITIMWSLTGYDNIKASLKKCSKREAVAHLARGRQCSHSAHINILHSIHFASNSLQLLSCKMIASHRSREQLVILLLMWALWREKSCHILADRRPEPNNTIKESSEKSEECEEWESKNLLQTKAVSHLNLKHAWKYHKVMFMSLLWQVCLTTRSRGGTVLEVWGAQTCSQFSLKVKYFKPHLHLAFMIPMKTENENC